MRNSQDLTTLINNDITQIYSEYMHVEQMVNTRKITEPQYLKKIYVLVCKAGVLKMVVDELLINGTNVNIKQIDMIDEIIDLLSERADMQNMDLLSDAETQSVYRFANKYKEIIPDECTDDLFKLD